MRMFHCAWDPSGGRWAMLEAVNGPSKFLGHYGPYPGPKLYELSSHGLRQPTEPPDMTSRADQDMSDRQGAETWENNEVFRFDCDVSVIRVA
jgi:hypothetical protein